jgi:glucosamine--fructose-6-phosphate aminotransferase (isomerizing)
MCGIVGAVAQRDVAPILLEGLKRLEYRGYDSAGMAVINATKLLNRHRTLGKVRQLQETLLNSPLVGSTGLAHTRWATHGKPSEQNAHPLMSGEIAVVHNGIIENHEKLRKQLIEMGYQFESETDTEIVGHLVHSFIKQGKTFLAAVQATVLQLEGAYAIGIMNAAEPHHIIAVRAGSPLVLGLGIGENFIASDHLALLSIAQKFIYLQEGDIVDVYRDQMLIYDTEGNSVQRDIHISDINYDIIDRGTYRHFMLKEIFEQPTAFSTTLEGRIGRHHVLEHSFGSTAAAIFDRVKHIQIAACGTSYHAGIVAKYWLEEIAGISCEVEPASEIRYRKHVTLPDTLFVTLSQSGETADTLAALRAAKSSNKYLSMLSICNVPESSLVRESDLCLLTHAGPEIGVASTKGFTTQLAALLLLTIALGKRKSLTAHDEEILINQLKTIPKNIEKVLELDKSIQTLANNFANKKHALFIGRGVHFPIALEGALKLKEISYIHAEAYPAGELKHGPLALIDKEMPVIALVPHDNLLEKMKSSIHEVRARGAELVIFTEAETEIEHQDGEKIILLPACEKIVKPLIYTVALQLLAYHVAVLKGTDVDQPRNLAKSVTVE